MPIMGHLLMWTTEVIKLRLGLFPLLRWTLSINEEGVPVKKTMQSESTRLRGNGVDPQLLLSHHRQRVVVGVLMIQLVVRLIVAFPPNLDQVVAAPLIAVAGKSNAIRHVIELAVFVEKFLSGVVASRLARNNPLANPLANLGQTGFALRAARTTLHGYKLEMLELVMNKL